MVWYGAIFEKREDFDATCSKYATAKMNVCFHGSHRYILEVFQLLKQSITLSFSGNSQ